jgi:tRNA(Ile)-lysidine synthase
MESAADELVQRAWRQSNDEWRIDAGVVANAPIALARRLMRRALAEAAQGRPVSYAHVEAALGLAIRGGSAIEGPGVRMQRVGSEVVLKGRPAGARGRPQTSSPNPFALALSIPGEVTAPDGRWVLTAESGIEANCAVTGTEFAVRVRRDLIGDVLAVRNRRPGDRFAPAGLIGRKKLQDFFVDRKVARDRRDSVPIVVDGRDRIVWVAGHAIDREFAVTDSAQAVVVLRLKLLGGRG